MSEPTKLEFMYRKPGEKEHQNITTVLDEIVIKLRELEQRLDHLESNWWLLSTQNLGICKSSPLIKRLIRAPVRTLNIPRGAIPHGVNPIEDKDVADRKFLQETAFEEDVDLDETLPERRAKDQIWRQAAQLKPRPIRPTPKNNW